jgi:peptidoglycan/xylan/chitin deacetylase (PgdA/CDA1 family)
MIFHRVLRDPDPMLPGEPSVAEFDALLTHLKRRFSILPLEQATARLYAGTLPSAALAITFDDGYLNNLTCAAPLLHRHAIPATVFVATGYTGGGAMWNDQVIAAFRSSEMRELDLRHLGLGKHSLASGEERRTALAKVLDTLKYLPQAQREREAREIASAAQVSLDGKLMLDEAGIRALAGYGVDVGAHTVTHPILASVDSYTAWREIVESKRALEEFAGKRITLFAYPNGRPGRDYGPDHVRMVREAGFAAAFSTTWGAADRANDRWQLPRFTPWTRQPLKFDLLMMRNYGRFQPVAT